MSHSITESLEMLGQITLPAKLQPLPTTPDNNIHTLPPQSASETAETEADAPAADQLALSASISQMKSLFHFFGVPIPHRHKHYNAQFNELLQAIEAEAESGKTPKKKKPAKRK